MGLVYHPERVSAGLIPTDANGQAQYDAAVVLGEALSEIAVTQPETGTALVAYMLYGSAYFQYRQQANRRSDVDALIILDDTAEPTDMARIIGERIIAVSRTFNVDVGATIYTKAQLENGMQINPFYAQHLDDVRSIVVNPVMQYFSPIFHYNEVSDAVFRKVPFVNAWPFAIEYLKARRSVFQTQLDQTDPDITLLKGPFELPRNLGRTLSDLFHQYIVEHTDSYDPILDELKTPLDRSQPYWLQLLQIADITNTTNLIGEDIERLKELDELYSGLLEATVFGDVSIAEYETWLTSVYTESLERAFKVVNLADALVTKTVEMAQADPTYDQVVFNENFLAGFYGQFPERQHELQKRIHQAWQIAPVGYDVERLLFKITPKYPEMARYKYGQSEQRSLKQSLDPLRLRTDWARLHAKLSRDGLKV